MWPYRIKYDDILNNDDPKIPSSFSEDLARITNDDYIKRLNKILRLVISVNAVADIVFQYITFPTEWLESSAETCFYIFMKCSSEQINLKTGITREKIQTLMKEGVENSYWYWEEVMAQAQKTSGIIAKVILEPTRFMNLLFIRENPEGVWLKALDEQNVQSVFFHDEKNNNYIEYFIPEGFVPLALDRALEIKRLSITLSKKQKIAFSRTIYGWKYKSTPLEALTQENDFQQSINSFSWIINEVAVQPQDGGLSAEWKLIHLHCLFKRAQSYFLMVTRFSPRDVEKVSLAQKDCVEVLETLADQKQSFEYPFCEGQGFTPLEGQRLPAFKQTVHAELSKIEDRIQQQNMPLTFSVVNNVERFKKLETYMKMGFFKHFIAEYDKIQMHIPKQFEDKFLALRTQAGELSGSAQASSAKPPTVKGLTK